VAPKKTRASEWEESLIANLLFSGGLFAGRFFQVLISVLAPSWVSVLRLKSCRWRLIPQQISGGEFKVDCL
jgi:hypothetical protein